MNSEQQSPLNITNYKPYPPVSLALNEEYIAVAHGSHIPHPNTSDSTNINHSPRLESVIHRLCSFPIHCVAKVHEIRGLAHLHPSHC
jgi:hypothetical protein